MQLSASIAMAEDRQSRDWHILKAAMEETSQSFRPDRLVKSVLEETAALPLFKNTLFKTVVGLTTGWFSGKVINGNQGVTVKKTVGSVVQFALSYFAANHADGIRTVGEKLINKIFRKKPKQPDAFSHNGNHNDQTSTLYDE